MSRSRRKNTLQNTLKDYIVPIIGGVLIIVLLYSIFGGSDEGQTQTNTSSTELSASGATISFDSADTKALVVNPGDVKEEITDASVLGIDETIIVESGSLELRPNNGDIINLNKIAEFQIDSEGSYNLYSSDAWITLKNDSNLSMRYANIEAPAGSILSLTQNEAGSTVYVLNGDIKVSNLSDLSTFVTKGQKITISRINAAKDDIDLAEEKTNIDSYFQGSDWFIANNGSTALSTESTPLTAEDTAGDNITDTNIQTPTSIVNTGEINGANTRFVQFTTLDDEISIDGGTMNISGTILSDDVSAITINNTQAIIESNKSFSLPNFALPNSINDLVVKVYDNSQNVVDKQVYTVYNSSGTVSNTTTTTNTSNTSTTVASPGTTFTADATQFGFAAPSNTGKFSTTSPEVTIRGFTTAEGIANVQVNGFTLNSFNGANWRYHAFKRFTTLKEGSNQYKIDYLDASGNIVYTDYFTIVKNTAATTTTTPTTTNPQVAAPTQDTSTVPEETLFGN